MNRFTPQMPSEFQKLPQPEAFDRAPRREFFVQNCDTRAFLDDFNDWTPNREEARIFKTSLDAIVCCLVRHYQDVQIIGTFNWPGCPDITIPVKSGSPELPDMAAMPRSLDSSRQN